MLISPEDLIYTMVLAGRGLISSGASATDVENELELLGRKNGYKTEVASTPTVIHLSLIDKMGKNWSRIERIKIERPDFYRLYEYRKVLNNYNRNNINHNELLNKLKELDKSRERYSLRLRTLGAATGAFAFSMVFGGTVLEASATFLIMLPIFFGISKVGGMNRVFLDLTAGFMITTLATFLSQFLPVRVDKIIVGAIMPFVPGILLTNSILELANRNLVSGTAKITESLLILTALVFGASSAFFLFGGV